MNEQISPLLKKILSYAIDEAGRLGNEYVGTEHVFLAMLREQNCTAIQILSSLLSSPNDLQNLKKEIEDNLRKEIHTSPDPIATPSHHRPINKQMDRMMKLMYIECKKLKQNIVEPEHALLTILRDDTSLVTGLLNVFSITYERYFQRCTHINPVASDSAASPSDSSPRSHSEPENLPSSSVPDKGENKQSSTNHNLSNLQKFGYDLTLMAENGQLDKIIGREKEIAQLIEILCHRKKNNPLLIGESGIGKTAIIEGLAQKIADKEIPTSLLNKRIFCFNNLSLVANTIYRGQLEEQVSIFLKQAAKNPDLIIFFDDIHTLLPDQSSTRDSASINEMLKPALSKGEIQCIAVTSTEKYANTLEKDASFNRLFQKLQIEPVDSSTTYEILNRHKALYEDFHHVKYTEEALQACIYYTLRCFSSNHLPSKAVEIMDAAGAASRIKATMASPQISNLQIQLNELQRSLKNYNRKKEYEKYGELIPQTQSLQEQLDREIQTWKSRTSHTSVIDKKEIAQTTALLSGIAFDSLNEDNIARILRLEQDLKQEIIGQDHIIDTICRYIQRNESGFKDPRRPIGSFLFIGSTGVGKTLLCKKLAQHLFGTESAFIRIDMSEYTMDHNVSRLIGASPGYVGYTAGGELTEKIRQHPSSVVLFDEVEKAHPSIHQLFLQILDEGRLTDSQGRVCDFKHSIIIMTSNIGSRKQSDFGNVLGFSSSSDRQPVSDRLQHITEKELHRIFAPEFLNRLDEILYFRLLQQEDLLKIVDLELNYVQEQLTPKEIRLHANAKAKNFLLEKTWNQKMGARPLKRGIQHYIVDEIANAYLKHYMDKTPFSSVEIGTNEEGTELVFTYSNSKRQKKSDRLKM